MTADSQEGKRGRKPHTQEDRAQRERDSISKTAETLSVDPERLEEFKVYHDLASWRRRFAGIVRQIHTAGDKSVVTEEEGKELLLAASDVGIHEGSKFDKIHQTLQERWAAWKQAREDRKVVEAGFLEKARKEAMEQILANKGSEGTARKSDTGPSQGLLHFMRKMEKAKEGLSAADITALDLSFKERRREDTDALVDKGLSVVSRSEIHDEVVLLEKEGRLLPEEKGLVDSALQDGNWRQAWSVLRAARSRARERKAHTRVETGLVFGNGDRVKPGGERKRSKHRSRREANRTHKVSRSHKAERVELEAEETLQEAQEAPETTMSPVEASEWEAMLASEAAEAAKTPASIEIEAEVAQESVADHKGP